MKILTHDDLLNALKVVNRKRARIIVWTEIIVFAAVCGLASFHARKADRLEGELVAARATLKASQDSAKAVKNELDGLKSAMTVSIDARRLGRPVRLSGEMIVVFAGEVRE